MTTLTPGTGGTIGGPPTPTPYELETRAEKFVAGVMLGIIPDSLDRSLTQINWYATWKPSSDASKPTIAPLNRLRVVLKFDQEVSDIWTNAFAKLAEYLSAETQEELKKEATLPRELRSPAYAALVKVMTWAAKGLIWIEGITKPLTPEELSITQAAKNLSLPSRFIESTLVESNDIINRAKNHLDQIGPNNPYFDGLSRLANEIDQLIGVIKEES